MCFIVTAKKYFPSRINQCSIYFSVSAGFHCLHCGCVSWCVHFSYITHWVFSVHPSVSCISTLFKGRLACLHRNYTCWGLRFEETCKMMANFLNYCLSKLLAKLLPVSEGQIGWHKLRDLLDICGFINTKMDIRQLQSSDSEQNTIWFSWSDFFL